jgi:hypothetical protein
VWPLIEPYEGDESGMLLPYLFTGEVVEATSSQLERLCEHMQPKLKQNLTVDKIQCLYGELVRYIDEELMAKSKYAELWHQARSGGLPKRQ